MIESNAIPRSNLCHSEVWKLNIISIVWGSSTT